MKGARRKTARPAQAMPAVSCEVPDVSAPGGLTAWCLDIGGPEFALFELPSDPGTNAAIEACLTAAEAEVARSMVAGLSNGEIAAQRNTSSRTVANQAASIFRKLHVGSRRELAAVVSRGGADARRGVP